MKISNVYLVGCGGTGSFLAEPLVRLMTFHNDGRDATITFVDGDKYEGEVDYLNPGNHNRQIFNAADNGKFKALATKKRLGFLSNNLESQVAYLSKDNFTDWLEDIHDGLSIFILAVDNHASRRVALDVLYEWNKDWIFITPGNGLDKGQVSLCGKMNGKEVGINPMTIYPDMANPIDNIPTMRKSCIVQAVSTPQLISANYLSSAAVLISVQNILDDGHVFDEIQFDVRRSKMIPGTKISLQSI